MKSGEGPAPDRRIAVVGLGYVGLPVAVAMAERFPGTIGFDISARRVAQLRDGEDITREVTSGRLVQSGLEITDDPERLADADFFIVAVPTPVTASNQPDLRALEAASRTVGAALNPGDVVVFESTVYPGVTEDTCGPILADVSGLECGRDFWLGYSPERINPGDEVHRFEKITKVVSGQTPEVLETVASVYGAVIEAGVHRASSIKVAEASKVIENVQRDLNIAFVNELAMIFDELGIDTLEVLEAAGTKWNFLPFRPGLVGGHCIGVDPYYLTTKAEELGFTPQVILAGRRINDGMGAFVGRATIKELGRAGELQAGARVAVLGLAFKENVSDLRNSRVPDIVAELRSFGVEVLVHDPLVDVDEARHEYGIELCPVEALTGVAAVVYAVAHDGLDELALSLVEGGAAVIADVKSRFASLSLPPHVRHWRL